MGNHWNVLAALTNLSLSLTSLEACTTTYLKLSLNMTALLVHLIGA